MPLHPTFQKFRNCRQALSYYSTALLSLCLTSGLNTCTFRHHPSVLSFLCSSIRLHLAPSVTLNQLGKKSEDSPHFAVPLVDITDGAKHPHLQMPCRSLYSRDSGRLGGKDGEREGDVGPPTSSPQQGRRNGVRVSSRDKDKRQNIPILHAFLPETRKKKKPTCGPSPPIPHAMPAVDLPPARVQDLVNARLPVLLGPRHLLGGQVTGSV